MHGVPPFAPGRLASVALTAFFLRPAWRRARAGFAAGARGDMRTSIGNGCIPESSACSSCGHLVLCRMQTVSWTNEGCSGMHPSSSRGQSTSKPPYARHRFRCRPCWASPRRRWQTRSSMGVVCTPDWPMLPAIQAAGTKRSRPFFTPEEAIGQLCQRCSAWSPSSGPITTLPGRHPHWTRRFPWFDKLPAVLGISIGVGGDLSFRRPWLALSFTPIYT
ncbi:hypothetical protein QBC47DRAFT_911 [Echria macrotheca]|uniref:Uncharacterized protein n=1 Tax=Echria macrotheca TaxID=438768 RepID=A0AAJ0BLH3_9PEZI|nr:hypothetical protein QBC47DRAFT_911 [Echria macrotheca]